MDYHKSTELLVVGTEEGIINVFDTSDDDLQFSKLLDRQDHRIVCCKFNHTGDRLVSGSIDAVKVWNIQTGHVIHKMSTGRANIHSETIVWCIEVLKDFTIITGDSRGRLSFWDGNLGSQIDWVQASTVDILCLSKSSNEKEIFCSGVEQLVRKYMKITTTKENHQTDQWIRCAKKYRLHTHDILTMTSIGDDEIVTSGIDGYLTRCNHELKVIERLGPFLRNPFVKIARKARLMLLMYSNYLEIWKLATGSDEEDKIIPSDVDEDEDEILKSFKPKTTSNNVKITSFPEKLLELRSQKDEMILSASISNDGKWIAYSTENSIRLFHFDIENGKPQLMRIKNLPEELLPCQQMAFSENLLITVNDKCSIFDINSSSTELRQTFELEDYHQDIVHIVEVSECGKYLSLASLCNNISIWCVKRGVFSHERNFPKHSCPVTSMKFHVNRPTFVMAFSDNRICEYNLEEFIINNSINSGDDTTKNVIANLCFDPTNSNVIIFNQNHSIMMIKSKDEIEMETKKMKKKKKDNEGVNNTGLRTVDVVKKLDNVSGFYT